MLLVIAEKRNNELIEVANECRFARLGSGLAASGRINDEALARGRAFAAEYAEIIRRHGATPHVIATQALREAQNGAAFADELAKLFGCAIEIISGEREAALALRAVRDALPALAGTPFAVVDVGGGSTEIIQVDARGNVAHAISLPMGAVRFTEQFVTSDPPGEGAHSRMERRANELLAKVPSKREPMPLVAVAGTATQLAALTQELTTYDPTLITGHKIDADELMMLVVTLFSRDEEERQEMPGMVAERAAVIPAGAAILDRVAERLGAEEVTICDRGIRYGLLAEALAAESPAT